MRDGGFSNHARDDDDDVGYFDLERLARYSGMSRSTLKRALTDAEHPLPHYNVRLTGKARGRILIRKTEFDVWVKHGKPAERTAAREQGPGDVSWIQRAFDKKKK